MALLPSFNFGLRRNDPYTRTDPYTGDVYHMLGRLTAFSSPATATRTAGATGSMTGSGTSTATSTGTGTGSGGVAPNVMSRNIQAARSAAATGTNLALEMSRRLEPHVAAQFYENLERAFPEYRDIFGQMTGNVEAALSGRLPADVADMIRMYSAEHGRQGALASIPRNLGLTSLERADVGFGQGMQLFDLASRYLTPPQMDVYGTAENIRNQLGAAGMVTPAQSGQLALESQRLALQKRAQDIQQMEFGASQDLAWARLRADQEQFSARMDWDREVSEMNQEFERWQFETAREAQQATERARAEAFSEFMSTLTASGMPAASTVQDLAREAAAESAPDAPLMLPPANPGRSAYAASTPWGSSNQFY